MTGEEHVVLSSFKQKHEHYYLHMNNLCSSGAEVFACIDSSPTYLECLMLGSSISESVGLKGSEMNPFYHWKPIVRHPFTGYKMPF